MLRIHRLPENLVAKIAAGEVIERPASVVKELVENSIDAGAKNIQIEVEEGGRKRITVIDDGCGMNREDVLLALERHATSKIGAEEDLFRIQTLGFRGEALPSIAAVSMMTLEACRPSETGTRVEVEGGKVIKIGSSSLPQGTRVTIQNLFFNTPARLKFMKSRETEFSHITAWIEAIALARPEVGFILRHNGKTELRTDPQTEVRSRISDVLGSEIAEFLHPVSASRGQLAGGPAALEVRGFVSDHRATGTSARSLFFFVNGRLVRDRTLQHAVLSAYETLLMRHRYPWVVLYLTVPPEFVDVNVHPTKSEVRFANGSLVHDLVREGVRGALRGGGGNLRGGGGVLEVPYAGASENESEKSNRVRELEIDARRNLTRRDEIDFAGRIERAGGGTERIPPPPLVPESLRILGQVHGTYLVCEAANKLILIDQHAAHERIGFERLKRQYREGGMEGGIQRQQLLIPQNFDLRPSQSEILKKYLDDLVRVGLEVEFFGGNTFILRTVPTLLEGGEVVSLIEELIEGLRSFERLTPLEERIDEVLERMACHRQVRAGDRLSNEEIRALLCEMGSTNFSGQCPHGRPAVLEVPFDEIEKWFKRRN